MAKTKRERVNLGISTNLSTRVARTSKYAHLLQHLLARHVARAGNGGADSQQPSDSKSRNKKGKAWNPHPFFNKQRPPQRPRTSAEKSAKQGYLDEQVGFIIRTRDNNKPNENGTASTTYAPLSWPNVAKAYNEKYRVSVTPAAMEKRVRQHRTAWIARHPSYPRSITYAKRPNGSSARRREDEHARRVPENGASNERIAGWVPPDELRNLCDIRNYINNATSIATATVTIQVLDAHEALLGTVSTESQLHGPLEKIVQTFVFCASENRLPYSLDHATCNGVSLVQLYCLAAQLEDDHVPRLVLERWWLLADQNKEVELALDELNLLFECTRCNDPAREFWTWSVCAVGLAEELLVMAGCGSALALGIRRRLAVG